MLMPKANANAFGQRQLSAWAHAFSSVTALHRVLATHVSNVRERGDDEISKRSSSARFCALLEEARDDE